MCSGVGTGSELSLALNTDRSELQSLLKELLLSDVGQVDGFCMMAGIEV